MNIHEITKQIRAFADHLESQNMPEPADPFAELKKAHAAGKAIEERFKTGKLGWVVSDDPQFEDPHYEFRAQPEPTFQLPPPPPGMRWHGKAWRKGDLPSGYRPLAIDEKLQPGDEGNYGDDFFVQFTGGNTNLFPQYHYRTRRPLTFEHAGKTWTWHRPGDPMPCRMDRFIFILVRGGEILKGNTTDFAYWGESCPEDDQIIGWRYAEPQTKTVPLGPEDVKPFTVIRRKGEAQAWHWRTVSYVDGVKVTCGNRGYGWVELASDYERNESLPLTGKWNPDAWEPCSKQIPA